MSHQSNLFESGERNKSTYYFYYKNSSRDIVPVEDDCLQSQAKEILKEIYVKYNNNIPKIFRENWDKVRLFETKGILENANSLILDKKEGIYNLNNKLNHLTGKEWTTFTCSWFIFNALQKDLKEERSLNMSTEDHPATYSPTMVENFIKFFTKEGMKVLDPFLGIGSTLVGCKRTGRVGYGVELNEKYYNIALKRVPEFNDNIVLGDSRKIRDYFWKEKFNFCISSPPYWNVLNRSTGSFEKKRKTNKYDIKYSDSKFDLGNIGEYDIFLDNLSKIYLDIYDLLVKGSYIVIIVKNIKKGGTIYPIAWDIARLLSKKYILKDEKIWIQDKIKLAPYGYPYSWAANILHHYCIIMRKEHE